MFHKKCIDSFEKFNADKRRNNCPICREEYEKRIIRVAVTAEGTSGPTTELPVPKQPKGKK
jgi:hypothetical protein